MYLHIGQDTVVREDDVVGIFDLDNTTVSPHTRKFLNQMEKSGGVITITEDIPKSFVLVGKMDNIRVYLSQISTATLRKRNEK